MSERRQRRRRPVAGSRDPHRRFEAWLIDGAVEVLPRDVMVHASLCSECRTRIAAFDLLTEVDLDRAGAPPSIAAAATRRSGSGVRMTAVATGAVAVSAAAVVAGVAASGWRPTLGGGDVNASGAPTQEVLGNTGEPQPTLAPSRTPHATPSHPAAASPSGLTSSDAQPTVAPPVTLPSAIATQRATASPRASATPRASRAPTPTPAPTVPPTPTPSAAPTDTPSPAPTPTP
jgi:hypothetical protein